MSSAPSSVVHRLPWELTDHILDHHHDDEQTLKACMLVCRAWLPSCRYHLFHSVTLQPGQNASLARWKPTACQRLHDAVELAPEIVVFIRKLVVCEGIFLGKRITQEETLPLFLRKLTVLRKLHLTWIANMRILWDTLPIPLTSAINSVLGLPTLVELKLAGMVFDDPMGFMQLLQPCTSLRSLEVEQLMFRIGFTHDAPLSWRERQCSSRLETLIIGRRTAVDGIICLLHPHSPIDISAVRRLCVSISGNSFAVFAGLLRSTPVVEELEITFMSDGKLPSSLPDGSSRFSVLIAFDVS